MHSPVDRLTGVIVDDIGNIVFAWSIISRPPNRIDVGSHGDMRSFRKLKEIRAAMFQSSQKKRKKREAASRRRQDYVAASEG